VTFRQVLGNNNYSDRNLEMIETFLIRDWHRHWTRERCGRT